MSVNVLVIGSGGREHSIVWKLSQSCKVNKIFAAPGSHAIGQVENVECVGIDIKNFEDVAKWCTSNNINLVIVGPEDPLANGIADILSAHKIAVFGPTKNAAQIESNKDWAKAFMDRHAIPTARWKSFTDSKSAKEFINNAPFPALVVKASGLAAGKGVVVAADKQEACNAVDSILTDKKFGLAGENVVIEELLEGEEVSFKTGRGKPWALHGDALYISRTENFQGGGHLSNLGMFPMWDFFEVLAFCDGKTVQAMLPAQDHKRIFDGDKGPNTGGMGAYCPCPLLTQEQLSYVNKHVLQQTVNGLQKENIKYVGVLYAGIMLTKNGPKVLEFNCRFGDPETEVILPMLESDLYDIMSACCNGTLNSVILKWKENVSAVGVVLASRGYPETSSKGQVITGIEKVLNLQDHVVFHCGTALKDGDVVTNGGRVLIAVALAPQLVMAASRATRAATVIEFDGKQFRKDIAHKGIPSSILNFGKLTYKASGVDITAGDQLVDYIKPIAKSTQRPGVMGGIGGFGGLFDLKVAGFQDPLLVSGTDGVGTKLKIAQEIGMHDTIGVDLVAMCVNDILAHGAEPLFFLDYFACGKLDVAVAKAVVSSIAYGCSLAGCALIGGETAEMPDMYPPGEYDLAGFSVGAVERKNLMPRINDIAEGDVIIGLPSSGIHSNGYSLVRKVVKISGLAYSDVAPFSDKGNTLGQELLTPTRIYVQDLKDVINSGKVKAFAHITGGGLTENIPRVLPATLGAQIDALTWKIPRVFGWLATTGGVNEFEMLRTFNCGIGAVVIVKKEDETAILKSLSKTGAVKIGHVCKRQQGHAVVVQNFAQSIEPIMKPHVGTLISKMMAPKKRVGVLISGSGTNLQALIDATLDPTQHMSAEIVLVISNKEDALGLKRAESANIPTKVIKHKDYPSRLEYDEDLHKALVAANVDIVCLAGFMRILTGEFTRKWKGRMLNVHPALLPLFKGAKAVEDAMNAGVRVTGCSVHFVEEDVDCGATLVQEAVPIYWNDTKETLQDRIHIAEHKAFPQALKLLATGKVKLGSDDKLIWS